MNNLDELAGVQLAQSAEELLIRRTFSSGYLLGRRHGYEEGYDSAVEESYPELDEGSSLSAEETKTHAQRAITEYLA